MKPLLRWVIVLIMKARQAVVKASAGFTLVELIIVITLTGIVSVLATSMLSNQMQGYIDTVRRASLVSKADAAIKMMARDFHNAVPYSVRSSGTAIEWVPIRDYGRYRKFPTAGSGDILDFSAADSQFDVFGSMPAMSAGNQLVIANTNTASSGFNIYQSNSDGSLLPAGSHVITSAGITPVSSGATVTLSAPFQFSQDSIASRFYVISGAASYVCNTITGELTRHTGYALQSTQPTSATLAPLSTSSSALLVDTVSSCSFGYSSVDATHGIVTVNLQLTDAGETISLVRFIHVENRP